jgi:hypothetical protein
MIRMRLITGNRANRLHRIARAVTVAAHVVAMLLIIPRSAAQDVGAPVDPLAPNQPRYTVEMIIFAYRTADSGNEIFVPDKPRLVPDPEELTELQLGENTYTDVPAEIPTDQAGLGEAEREQDARTSQRELIELNLLEPDESTMDQIYGTLRRLDAYQPIMRAAWTQTTPPKETSPAVHLRALGEPPQGLDGSITLYQGRYLHMIVDLALDAGSEEEQMTATDRLVAYGDRLSGHDTGAEYDSSLRMPVRYRIVEDRIMKTGETRYFDHPRFGVIAKVTKPPDDVARVASPPAD